MRGMCPIFGEKKGRVKFHIYSHLLRRKVACNRVRTEVPQALTAPMQTRAVDVDDICIDICIDICRFFERIGIVGSR